MKGSVTVRRNDSDETPVRTFERKRTYEPAELCEKEKGTVGSSSWKRERRKEWSKERCWWRGRRRPVCWFAREARPAIREKLSSSDARFISTISL